MRTSYRPKYKAYIVFISAEFTDFETFSGFLALFHCSCKIHYDDQGSSYGRNEEGLISILKCDQYSI